MITIDNHEVAHELVMEAAAAYLESEALKRTARQPVCSSEAAIELVKHKIGWLQHEVFSVLFLDQANRLIAYEQMFRGTVNGAQVIPREVAKTALFHNAAGVILAHNHPSGELTPSAADKAITKRLVLALELVGTKVVDHIIVSPCGAASFSGLGLI